ncbi:uncharacterized protein DSM5745_10487 [Aspergillus mulundensis]|uniref:PA14 domain-containing protein n=1 Tax=Aspergillus mulundensis TaxID=1810919 RepID=A0A3D8QJ31_9EURO|nr:hypothetical protein DSM5745_10487 [Aspergillus mulundensis]RDW61815.1 hypothetical protein DSM5745_10487 [Aspergillus mulundensis]
MKPLIFFMLLASCTAQLPFPWPFCASTTTFSLAGTYTVTSTSTITSGTSTTTVTAPTSVSIAQSRTTVYTPTSVTCLSTATTLTAYPSLGLDGSTLAIREAKPQITIPPLLPTGCSSVTIIQPTVADGPCTRVEGDFVLATSTVTTTTSGVLTETTTPISTQTVTETWVQPTPTSFNGLNYYQYLNAYNYNSATTGLGGGGYSTSHWLGNTSYLTTGLTRNINFESPNWPTGAALCQLPGQSAATDCSQWTVVFQGFMFARVPGPYVVHSPIASETAKWQDNAGFWWGGSKAYATYTDGNVDGAATPLGIEGVDNYAAYELVAGEFLPFTFIYSNGQGPAANRVDVTGPDGVVYPEDLELFVPPCEDSAFVP